MRGKEPRTTRRGATGSLSARALVGCVAVASLGALAAVALPATTVGADTIPIDPVTPGCNPADFAGLPFNPCDALGADPNVDDPNNPCDGLIISGQRRNTPDVVVQYFNVPNPDPNVTTPVSGLPVCLMEQEVIAEIAAERGVTLNAEERAEILTYGRDEIRARLVARLITLQDQVNEGATLNTLEQGALAWAQAIQINNQRAVANAALAEYEAWKAAPCHYVPPSPHQYNVAGDPGCAGGIAGLFTSVTPPTYNDFVTYGVTLMTNGHHGAAALATAEMAIALQMGLVASTAGVGTFGALLAGGGLAAGFLTPLKVAIIPYAFKVAADGSLIAAGGGGAGGAFFAAAFAVVIALTVVTIIRVTQLFDQAAIGTQLQADVAAAQTTTAELDPVAFMMLFADATVPRFDPPSVAPASAVPNPSPAGPYFTTVQEGSSTRAPWIVYRSGGANYRAWMSDGWWVVEPLGSPEQRTLTPLLMLLDDNDEPLGFVSFIDGQFIVLDAATAADGSLFLAAAPPRSNPSSLNDPVVARFEVATPPTATPDAPAVSVDEGGDVTISGTVTGATALRVDLADGSPVDVAINPDDSFSLTRRYTDDVGFTAIVIPRDNLGNGVPAYVDVTVNNVDPAITGLSLTSRGAPIHPAGLRTGEPITASVSFTDPGFNDTHLITIDWGDGTVSGPQVSGTASHFYDNVGTYPIVVQVVDDDGGMDQTIGSVTVVKYPNLVDVAGGSGHEGDILAISGRLVGTDPTQSFVRVGASTSSPRDYPVTSTGHFSIPLLLFDDTFTLIELTAFGEGSEGATIGVDVVVQNVAPTITSLTVTDTGGNPGPFTVGETVRVELDFTDPGQSDTHTTTIDWGDGTITTDEFEHTYTGSVGLYTATVTVTDDDNGSDVELVDVVFDIAPPTAAVTLADGQAPDTNEPVEFIVTFDEPVTGFDEDDVEIIGATGTVVVEPTGDPTVYRVIVTPTSDGPFTIRVNTDGVTDSHGNAGDQSGEGAPMGPEVLFIDDDPNPGVNDAPQVTAPRSIELELAAPTALPITVTDPDALDGEIAVTVEFTVGTLSAAGPATVSGSGTSQLTVTGTLADVNDTLADLLVSADGLGAGSVSIEVDDQGNTGGSAEGGTASVAVTVVDTTPPTIRVPIIRIVARTDPGLPTATVTFEVTVEDADPSVSGITGPAVETDPGLSAAPTLLCTPASGSTFPIGLTTVTCTASDTSGNTATTSFVVEVLDEELPVVDGTADQRVQLSVGSTGAVTYALPLASDNSGEVDLVCTPASGATLSAGLTEVTCTATDPSGNVATASFMIEVVAGPRQLPATGNDASLTWRLALLLLAAGVALTTIDGRLRRRAR